MVGRERARKVVPRTRKQVQTGKHMALSTMARNESNMNINRHVVTMNDKKGKRKFISPRFKKHITADK